MAGKEKFLSKRILATLLAGAVLGVCNLMPVYAANSGGTWSGESWTKDDEYIGDKSPTGSTVVIAEDNSGKRVYGGKDNRAAVANNTVTITGTIGNAYGGAGSDYDVSSNHVIVDGGTVTNTLQGGVLTANGDTELGNAVNNKVTIKNGTIDASVYGGAVNGEGNATGNEVIIESGTITGMVFGGSAAENGYTKGNKVTVTEGTFSNKIYGGNSKKNKSNNNIVTINGGTFTNTNTMTDGIYGGYSAQNTNDYVATGNQVIINCGTFTSKVYGAYSQYGKVKENGVAVGGSTTEMKNVYGGYVNDANTAEKNWVTVTDGKIDNVVGGYSWSGDAIENCVIISGGTISKGVKGGQTADGSANGNKVIISGGEINSKIYGGYCTSEPADGNEITISGGKINSEVIAGGRSGNGTAINNVITINAASGEKPVFSADTIIYGGDNTTSSKDKRTGNTLNLQTKGLEMKNIANFENLNFYLQEDTINGDTILTLTDDKGTDISGSNVNVGIAGSTSTLQVGDMVNLLTNSNGITADNVTYGRLQQGVSIKYEFTTDLSGNSIVATVDKAPVKTTEQSKSPVETQIASAAFVNSGADTVAGSGIANAVQTAGRSSAEMFGASGGGNMRYKSGSYSDMRGYNLALGFAKAIQNNAGKLTYGPLLEYGWGNYTSHLDSGIRADGNTKYYGIGMIVRQDNNSGLYYEGSVRYGRMDADYASGDMIGAGGSKVYADYDSSSSYYGAHVGIGRVSKLNDTVKADIYAKLLYTHQSGDSVILGGAGNGEVYDFDAVNSTRARLGARLSKENGERGTYYAGLAYEYEFDGEAKATVKGLSTPAPSIKGSSGMLELGYIIQNKDVNAPAVDIGFQGWSGKKQGFSGNINFIWKF